MREVVWVRWENIVLPILVLVSEGKFRIFENADRPKVAGGGRNRDDSFRQLQTIRGAAFRPHLQLVPPIRDLVYGDAPFGIRHAVIRRVHGDHDSAHLRMNIAKERTYARAIKSHGFGGACFIESQVETLSVKEQKNIVEKRIPVGKLNQ